MNACKLGLITQSIFEQDQPDPLNLMQYVEKVYEKVCGVYPHVIIDCSKSYKFQAAWEEKKRSSRLFPRIIVESNRDAIASKYKRKCPVHSDTT